jgi:hypothetical protein
MFPARNNPPLGGPPNNSTLEREKGFEPSMVPRLLGKETGHHRGTRQRCRLAGERRFDRLAPPAQGGDQHESEVGDRCQRQAHPAPNEQPRRSGLDAN